MYKKREKTTPKPSLNYIEQPCVHITFVPFLCPMNHQSKFPFKDCFTVIYRWSSVVEDPSISFIPNTPSHYYNYIHCKR
jgi:hypothetical protein